MTYPTFWPGTKIVKSMDNDFSAHERGATTINWAKEPDFRTSVKQREQQAKAKAAGWGNGDLGAMSDRPRVVDLAPRIHSNICKPRGR